MTVFTDLQARALTVIRRSTPRSQWDEIAERIVQDRSTVEAHLKADKPQNDFRALLPNLKTFSHAKIPLVVPNVEEVRTYFDAQPVYKGSHIFSFDGRPKPHDEVRRTFPLVGYSNEQVLRAPGLLDVMNDARLLDLIEQQLGCVPTLYSVNAWWSHPADKPEMTNVQYFHRDTDDFRFLTLFIYLTDVGLDGGPHQVIPGSHTLEGMRELVRKASWWPRFDVERSFVDDMGEDFSRDVERLLGDTAASLTGKAGEMALVNTVALHRGLVPTRTSRLIVWARYGLGPNTNSNDLQQGPLGPRLIPTTMKDTPRARYINRLLYEFDRAPG